MLPETSLWMLRILWNLVVYSASETLTGTFLVDVVVYMSWNCCRAAWSIDANLELVLTGRGETQRPTASECFAWKGAASSTTTSTQSSLHSDSYGDHREDGG